MSTIDDLLYRAYRGWDDPGLLTRIGRELQVRSRFDHARRILRRAVELDPSNDDAWANLSFAHFRSLEDEEGRAVLREAIEKSGHESLKSTLAGFSEGEEAETLVKELEGSANDQVRADNLSRRFWAGDHEEALQELGALVEANPDDESIRSSYLWTLLGAKNRGMVEGLDLHQTGLPIVDRGLAKDPDHFDLRWMRLNFLQAEKDWDGLLEETAETLRRFPDEETVMQFRGRAYREKDDPERAAQWFLRAIGAKPSFVGARVDLGRLYEAQGKLELAEEVFRESPNANPSYPVAPLSLALFLGRQERWEEAEPAFLDAWRGLPAPFRAGFAQNPEVQTFFARDAVKAALDDPTGKDEGEDAS